VFLGAASYGGARPDVGGLYGTRFTNSGFGLTASGLASGVHQLVAFMHSTVTGTVALSKAVTVTAEPLSTPRLSIDTPSSGLTVTQPFTMAGWAVDLGAPSGTGVDAVHLYTYPNPGSGAPAVFLGAAVYGGARSDVAAAFSSQFTSSGYGLTIGGLSPGAHQLVAFAHSTQTGIFHAATVTVTVAAPVSDPRMSVDLPSPNASLGQPFLVAGWAIDRGSGSGTGVDAIHVWAFPLSGGGPIFLGAASYGGTRPDVGGIFGSRFTNSGFGLMAAGLNPGTYDVVVYARSTVTGTFNNARVVRVTVT
jgi:hypothetical protein